MQDFASYARERMPPDILEQMDLKKNVVDSAGNPVTKLIAKRWLRNKEPAEVARFIHDHRPKDAAAQPVNVE